ncbi:MAG TPA: hypothetical protein VEC01_19470 [Noviherbaspirillum sp.]|uniref:hypothetical protein n=1 Tax=Noviherbaspirillum sp. TaxID=1926288 RepID=UPI002D5B9AD2|nr:hypothetical protein [Noviherbaspirillum sp.]HYD97510.1 hypothetical protein [Noviherbaspirillum sp.]
MDTTGTLSKDSDYERFLDLLPWYVNRTLGEADRNWVDAYLVREPDARFDLELERSVANEVARQIDAQPADAGLRRLQELVRTDSKTARAVPGRPGRWASLWQRMRDAASRITGGQAGWAMACTLQAGVIALLLMQPATESEDQYRALGAPALPTIVVQVRESTPEKDLRALLLREGAEIVAGPSQLGEYRLTAKRGDVQALAKSLVTSPIIESVSVERNSGSQR